MEHDVLGEASNGRDPPWQKQRFLLRGLLRKQGTVLKKLSIRAHSSEGSDSAKHALVSHLARATCT